MTNEYIRKRDAVDALAKTMPTPATPDGAGEFDHEIHIADEAFADAIRIIESLEPADVVQVVRCVDCRRCSYDPLFNYFWCNLTLGTRRVKPDDFCSYGEKRGEE